MDLELYTIIPLCGEVSLPLGGPASLVSCGGGGVGAWGGVLPGRRVPSCTGLCPDVTSCCKCPLVAEWVGVAFLDFLAFLGGLADALSVVESPLDLLWASSCPGGLAGALAVVE